MKGKSCVYLWERDSEREELYFWMLFKQIILKFLKVTVCSVWECALILGVFQMQCHHQIW